MSVVYLDEFKKLKEKKSEVQILSDEEIKILIIQLQKGQEEIIEEEVVKLLEWAEHTRISSTLLDILLDGHLIVKLDIDGQPIFSADESNES